jgi:hypothetical protein
MGRNYWRLILLLVSITLVGCVSVLVINDSDGTTQQEEEINEAKQEITL